MVTGLFSFITLPANYDNKSVILSVVRVRNPVRSFGNKISLFVLEECVDSSRERCSWTQYILSHPDYYLILLTYIEIYDVLIHLSKILSYTKFIKKLCL